jgi:hypothetical protein
MRISNPLILGSIAAIAVAIVFVLLYPHYILSLGLAPTGISLQDFYKAKTILDLPPSIQELMKYQYPLAILFASASFGAVYFGLADATFCHWLIIISCLQPIVSFVFFPVLLLSPLIWLALIIGSIWHGRSHRQLLIPYIYCLATNSICAIVIWLHINDVFRIIA